MRAMVTIWVGWRGFGRRRGKDEVAGRVRFAVSEVPLVVIICLLPDGYEENEGKRSNISCNETCPSVNQAEGWDALGSVPILSAGINCDSATRRK